MLSHFSPVQLFATLWTLACQAPLSMEFSRQEYWSGLPFPPPGDLPDPGIQPTFLLMFPALAGKFFTTHATYEAFPQASGAPHHKFPQLAMGTPICYALHPPIPPPCSLCRFPVVARGSFGKRLMSKQRKLAQNCKLGRNSKLELQHQVQCTWEKQNGGCQHTSWCTAGLRGGIPA